MTRVIIVAIVLLIAIVLYLLIRGLMKRANKRPRTIAPDDDPDFLRGLGNPPGDGPTSD